MTSVTRYTPVPVILPVAGPLSRTFLKDKQHLPGRARLEQSDYAGYDTHNVFYDVFIDADGSCLRAIGPPLVNLKKNLLPISVSVTDSEQKLDESAPLAHSMNESYRLGRHRFSLPSRYQQSDKLQIKMRLGNGQTVEQTVSRQCYPQVKLQFTTLQKNNPTEWIVDWLLNCQDLGVERVLLYDNGSDNQNAIEAALKRIKFDMQVVLIDWPYPYGPRRSYYNYFCQAAQNNHTYQCFGNAEWTGHFDIDEFLTGVNKSELYALLNQASRRSGLLRFDSYLVPNVRDDFERLPTVRDFPYRARALHKKAHKYIAQNRALKLAKTHNGKVKLGYWRTEVKPSVAVFFHYMGLTINWRGDDPRQHRVEFNPDTNIEDQSVIDSMKRLDISLDTGSHNRLEKQVKKTNGR